MENTPTPAPRLAPTVILYQNPEFVSGILQEIFKTGILNSSESGYNSMSGSSGETTGKIEGSGGASARIPFTEAKIGASGERVKTESHNGETSTADRRKFTYSSAYYLDQIRTELHKGGLIRNLQEAKDAEGAEVGDFVEFSATFKANEINSILDILSPSLTAEIARYFARSEGIREIEEVQDHLDDIGSQISIEKIHTIKAIHEAKGETWANLAAAVTTAVRTDFRGDTTKEFYGKVGTGENSFSAVTVCEADSFISKDPDRILDGQFTVLGKLISECRANVPVLEKNKILNRLNLDSIQDSIGYLADDDRLEKYLDIRISTIVPGKSITVLPVAIYI